MQGMADQEALARVHYELIKGLIEHGTSPSTSVLTERLDATRAEVEGLLSELASIHGLVLHPHVREPWIIHPFSLTPTINWVTGETGSWWAPCIWCALGVAVLVGGSTYIHTRYGAEEEPLVIEVVDGQPVRQDIVIHFAIPPARAWDNVHEHCSLVLPFHSPQHIRDWCKRHGVAMGEAVPLQTVSDLARAWYGSHASPHWRKWTVEQAQEIFSRVGLTSKFWRLDLPQGHF
jgi:Alkylmercury lyase